jgi:hypothetical protein
MGRVDLAGKLADTRTRVAEESAAPATAPYELLVRKEARMREDQHTALTALARGLMGRRARKAERITENTLIRVAIDLLLAQQGSLRGATEQELRQSVIRELRNPGTSEVRKSVTAELREPGSSAVRAQGSPDRGEFGSPDAGWER